VVPESLRLRKMERAEESFEGSDKSVGEGKGTVEALKFLNKGSANDVSC